MNRDTLEAMTKADLVERARAVGLRGRSKMNKAELVEALAQPTEAAPIEAGPEAASMFQIPGISQDDRLEARVRRSALYERLARLVDQTRRCAWRGIVGHGCGLPIVRGTQSCTLHSGQNGYDVAVPATGRLGFDT